MIYNQVKIDRFYMGVFSTVQIYSGIFPVIVNQALNVK